MAYYYPDDCGCREADGRSLIFWSAGFGAVGGVAGAEHGAKIAGARFGWIWGGVGWILINLFEGPGHCACGDRSKGDCHCTTPPRGPNGNWAWPNAQDTKHDPIVIDLNRDGNTDLTNTVYFDLDTNGFAEATNWIDGSDGLLVMDRNDNGIIDDGSELFGDHTVKSDGNLATSGFDALSDLDSNNDGVIDANDAAFSQLRVLTDVNGDGDFGADEYIWKPKLTTAIYTRRDETLKHAEKSDKVINQGDRRSISCFTLR
jgi:hypothetical protein